MADLDVEQYRRREAAAERAARVRGRHYTEWIPTLNELRSAGQDDQALTLLLECISATERTAAVHGREPAPAYTERAAIIYRRRGDRDAEAAILRRYLAACPPGRGGPDSKIGRRLRKLLGTG